MDWISEQLGWIAGFAVMAACLISSGNAIIRYGFDKSSNAWLEIQWYLFAVTVMLGASLVLKLNEHVRVDILYTRLPGNGRVYLDIGGLCFFLLPVMGFMAYMSWPLFFKFYVTQEMSSNAGGLIRWPAMLMLPLGFTLLCLQAVAEIIKRVGHLTGSYQMDVHYDRPLQ